MYAPHKKWMARAAGAIMLLCAGGALAQAFPAKPIHFIVPFAPGGVTDVLVRECAQAGIKRVWLYRGGGRGAGSPGAVKFCEDNDIAVIPGECPFMFFPETGWMHRVHGFVRKIAGTYPVTG